MFVDFPADAALSAATVPPMISACPWFALLWSSLLLTDVHLPTFSASVGVAALNDLNCSRIHIGEMSGTFNSSLWSISTTEPSSILCSVGFRVGILHSRVISDLVVKPTEVSINKSSSENCLASKMHTNRCSLAVDFKELRTEPRNVLLQAGLNLFKSLVKRQINAYVCKVLLPSLEKAVSDGVLEPPLPYPSLVNGSTPLGDSLLFRTALNVLNNMPVMYGVQLNASMEVETTIHIGVYFSRGLHVTMKELLESGAFIMSISRRLMELREASSSGNSTWDVLGLLPTVDNATGAVVLPHPFSASFDVSFADFRCDATGESCSMPCSEGVILENIRTQGAGDWDVVVVNYIGPVVAQLAKMVFNKTMMPVCDKRDNRLEIPALKESSLDRTPPPVLWGVALAVFVSLIPAGVAFGAWRHRREPALLPNGIPLSMRRVILEDLVLMVMSVVTAFGFIYSNSTTAATLVVGHELRVLSFSLMETTRSLYNADLKVFAVLVFSFSGVYPYIKLLCILMCTLILQKPNLLILKVIDYFGKFSFIDLYAMVIMASGLQIAGIAEVQILPGFYFFLCSTILSILTGNYATAVWRRNTSIRCIHGPNSGYEPDSQNVLIAPISTSFISTIKECTDTPQWNTRSVLFRALNGIFVAICILPAWIFPCLRYTVSGVASVIQSEARDMSLFELNSSSGMLLVTCLFTIGVAPVLYSLVYPKWHLLASWCAVDVLLLACVAGLLQLGQFVAFILGDNMGDIYSAKAELLWPLIPLLIFAVWQWILVAEHIFNVSGCIRRRWGLCDASSEKQRRMSEEEKEKGGACNNEA